MHLSIHGAGYVGLVTAGCFAEMGNHVVCCDVDERKISALNQGKSPIYEPGLEVLIQKNLQSGHLRFTTDPFHAISEGDLQFIAVGTPPDEDGSADLTHVLEVACTIGRFMKEKKIIINKSTVPVGTAEKVKDAIQHALNDRQVEIDFDVVSNPEFLKEGSAVNDFMRPDRIIVGGENHEALEVLRQLYQPFNRNHDRFLTMDARSAELTKYVANAMLATRISFMNEMSHLAEQLGADIEEVRKGVGMDIRIGSHFIYPGCGYGGSCFPKDVKALQKMAHDVSVDSPILKAVEHVNIKQKNYLVEKIKRHFQTVENKAFALWGLSFKPNTDDMREASSRVIMEALWQMGARIQAYDPIAMFEARRLYSDRSALYLCESMEQTLEGAEALIIVTEWNAFKSPDFECIKRTLKQPVIFDGRNLYDPKLMKELGIIYYGMGRGEQLTNDV